MTSRTITLSVPEDLYTSLEAQAQAASRSVSEVMVQTLASTFPPIEPDLPDHLRIEFKAMEVLSDDALWQIAQSTINPDKAALWDVLLERSRAGELTHEGRDLLTRLREEGDELMLRKAQAYLLLKLRGHRIPTQADFAASGS